MKFWRWIEWSVVFLGVPTLFAMDLIPIPKLLALGLVALAAVILLRLDPKFSFRADWEGRRDHPGWKRLIFKSAVAAFLLTALVLWLHPDRLFAFPRSNPGWWLLLMVIYPLLSALPQEVIYRSFYFHRYEKIFRSPLMLILSSASVFAYLHIIYANWWAVGLSFVGGTVFALTYRKSGSLLLTATEHAIYGCLLFTIGLGSYFYEAL